MYAKPFLAHLAELMPIHISCCVIDCLCLSSKFFCQKNPKSSMNLLAVAVGIKQKEIVDKIIRKVLVTSLAPLLLSE